MNIELDSYYLSVGICAAATLGALCYLGIVRAGRLRTKRVVKRAGTRIFEIRSKIEEFQRLKDLLDIQSSKHFQCLHSDLNLESTAIDERIKSVRSVCSKVDYLISKDQIDVVEAMLTFLDEQKVSADLEPYVDETTEAAMSNWQTELQQNLQCIGEKIAQASIEFNGLLSESARKRKKTLLNLEQAGIDLKKLRQSLDE